MSYSGFLRTFLACCLREDGYLPKVAHLLESEAFKADPRISWLVSFLRRYWNEYRERPTREIVLLEVANDGNMPEEMRKELVIFLESLYSLELDVGKDYAVKEVADRLIRYKMAQDLILLRQMIEAEVDVAELRRQLRHMMSYSQGVEVDMGLDFEESLDRVEELLEVIRDRIPTGFPLLDVCLAGGMPRGTELILCSTPKAGKSFFLINLAINAFFNGYNVVYFTLELPKTEIQQRMIQVAGGVSYQALLSLEGATASLKRAAERIKKKIDMLRSGRGSRRNYLKIQEYPTYRASADHLSAYINLLDDVPDVIIVDYAELIRPTVSIREKRHSLGQVVLELRGLAGEYNAVLYTAWQANRESMNQRLIHEGNLSESWEPAKHTDVLLTLTEMWDEGEDYLSRLADEDAMPYEPYKLFLALSRIGGRQKVTFTLRKNRGTGYMEVLGEEDILYDKGEGAYDDDAGGI